MFKEIAEIRRATNDLEKTIHRSRFLWEAVFKQFFNFLSNIKVIATLAVTGLYAAFMEVKADISMGGHHGAAFLAFHDIIELMEESHFMNRCAFISPILHSSVVKITLMIAALGTALFETVTSLGHKKFGAHHGTLILSVITRFNGHFSQRSKGM